MSKQYDSSTQSRCPDSWAHNLAWRCPDSWWRPLIWHLYIVINMSTQGGEDPQDDLSCRSFFAKEPIIIGLFCGQWPMKIRHPMGLRHPVWYDSPTLCNLDAQILDGAHWFGSFTYTHKLIERTPTPPWGVFLFTMLPHQEPWVRGPRSKNLCQVLREGSSYSRFLMREHSK